MNLANSFPMSQNANRPAIRIAFAKQTAGLSVSVPISNQVIDAE